MSEKKETPFLQKTVVVWVLALVCCALWGSAFPCIKIGYRLFAIEASDTATQILFAGCRFTLAGIIAILIGSVLNHTFLYPKKNAWGKVLWLSMLQTVLQYFFFYIGLAHTSGVKASIIEAVSVFVAIFVASMIFHQEALTKQKLLGSLIGFIGVVLINLNGLTFEFVWNGEGFILISTIAYAFSSVYLKRFSVEHHPVMLSGYQFVLGGIIMMIGGLMMGGKITQVSASGIGMLIYLALVSSVAYSLWGILLKHNPVSKVSVFGFMNPVCGVLLSAILLQEQNQAGGVICLISLVLVCVGITISQRGKKN